jgi:hypothetical protein
MLEALDGAGRADLERALQPGERVLWTSPHDWRATMRGAIRSLAIVTIVLALLGVGIYFALFSSGRHDGPVGLIVASPFVIAWLITAALMIASAWWTRRRVYAITDRAVLVTRRDPWFAVERYLPDKGDVEIRPRKSGAADLIVAWREIGNTRQPLGFFHLANAYAVQRILFEAPFMRAA